MEKHGTDVFAELSRLREVNADLLAALDSTCPPEQSDLDSDGMGECIWCHVAVNVDNGDDQCQQPECPGVKARAAIAKAKGA